ncbi:MAG: RagB/SusD family nutrient uptake outer membrane protein [Bacteroidales bacterium]|nr:RagB/SusD family nutrient uptake outer membrane protein [Bacteroidales bacterium]
MIKTLSKAMLAAVAAMSLTGCDDYFDLQPSNEMVLDEFWKSEEDVLSVTGSCYRTMQEGDFLKRALVWGEFRGDNVILSQTNTDNDLRYIANLNLLPSNWYTNWGKFYEVINLCNTVEYFAPGVREEDPNFTQSQLNAYLAEVKGLRAWSAFTLVRAFRDIPFTTVPTIDDTEEFSLPQRDPDEIIDFLIQDLKDIEPYAASTYSNRTYTKGRITQAAIRAIIADMCLWRGRYDEVVDYCDRILNDANNPLILESSMSFSRNLFIDGISSETIFELQFNQQNNMINSVVGEYYALPTQGGSQKLTATEIGDETSSLFAETDIRRKTSMYSNSGNCMIQKYVGYLTANELSGTSNITSASYHTGDISPHWANWIVYRLPDIYLMKAEALCESGTDLEEAFRLACITYDRANPEAGAGSLSFENYSSREALLNFIFDERRREFLFEGKRYFDILRRISHHRDQFRTLVSTYLAPKYADLDQSTVSSKLSVYDALFVPINDKELRANLLLVQNPFYKTSSDISH